MRDGVRLATTLLIPHELPAPALLMRLPYGKQLYPGVVTHAMLPNPFDLVMAGYAVVWQDCRGTYDSEGEFAPWVNETDDGLDTLNWIRRQEWCSGSVGMYGLSYLAMAEWMAASRSPEGLRALASGFSATDFHAAWYSSGGAMSWHSVLMWSVGLALVDARRSLAAGEGDVEVVARLQAMADDPVPHLSVPPNQQFLLSQQLPWWSDLTTHPELDEHWRTLNPAERPADVLVPALHLGGWFDIFIEDTVRSYMRLRSGAGTEEARSGQRLIIGPWDHVNQTGVYLDRHFGPAAGAATVGLTRAHLDHFDRSIHGTAPNDEDAPVRIFVMGIDQWRDEADWPLPDTQYVDHYLEGAPGVNRIGNEGGLSTDLPSASAVDTYVFDPADPTPTMGGRMGWRGIALNAIGPVDQRAVEARPDVLCFTSPILQDPIEVTGHVALVLHATSSARDTDFTGKLVDVHPDGRAIYLTDGILRMRYRDGLDRPASMEPGRVYEITLNLGVTSNVFGRGHRIRVEVSSSNFPRYDCNPNTGRDVASESAGRDGIRAINRILRGANHPSRLVLPVIRR
ncbi:CocE/NonD family hydrolase [Aeromicrobium phragmitis]|uniref:CocE/NonD family hydrolase n=1 Tax=Aeromicrobium phragmitis TaxID=2478914 RepID=A0A3L8PM50_9ACTN|nr:CocE/NonD family hydrolase [Aeromicrobium phragmitis]RLV55823.1 CocE/NonD family hydrolase [Aeromicrobium phragmitis]